MAGTEADLRAELDRTMDRLSEAIDAHPPRLEIRETGTVRSVGHGTARLSGLPGVRAEELIVLPGGVLAMAFNLDRDGGRRHPAGREPIAAGRG